MSLRHLCCRCQLLRPYRLNGVGTRLFHAPALRLQAATPSHSVSASFDPYNQQPSASAQNTSSSFSSASSSSSSTSHSSNARSTSAAPTSQSPPLAEDGTEQLRLTILNAALQLVPVHGWTDQTLQNALRSTPYSPSVLTMLQPEPVWCLIAHHLSQSTHAAFTSYHTLPLASLNKLQRTTQLLSRLLSAHSPYMSQLSAMLGVCFAPSLMLHSLPLLAELTDECMYVLQDSSTSTDWYGRRVAFASIWVGGLLHRSVDRSEGGRDTQQWLERRVDEWVRGEETLGELGVMADIYGGMGYNALLNMLAGKK